MDIVTNYSIKPHSTLIYLIVSENVRLTYANYTYNIVVLRIVIF